MTSNTIDARCGATLQLVAANPVRGRRALLALRRARPFGDGAGAAKTGLRVTARALVARFAVRAVVLVCEIAHDVCAWNACGREWHTCAPWAVVAQRAWLATSLAILVLVRVALTRSTKRGAWPGKTTHGAVDRSDGACDAKGALGTISALRLTRETYLLRIRPTWTGHGCGRTFNAVHAGFASHAHCGR